MSDVSGVSSSLGGLFQSLNVSASSSLATVATAAQQLGGLFANLNLSSTQQTQISQILQTSQGKSPAQVAAEINRILTPAQQAQLQADLARVANYHHHHHGSAASSASSNTDAFGIPVPSSSTTNSGTLGSIAATFSAQNLLQNGSTD
jgi:hypothetical protein